MTLNRCKREIMIMLVIEEGVKTMVLGVICGIVMIVVLVVVTGSEVS